MTCLYVFLFCDFVICEVFILNGRRACRVRWESAFKGRGGKWFSAVSGQKMTAAAGFDLPGPAMEAAGKSEGRRNHPAAFVFNQPTQPTIIKTLPRVCPWSA
jgi:hypothetical protein